MLPPHTATLEVDLSALGANYRLLKEKHARRSISAVVKADAYGLGCAPVSKALWNEGCREFFVATLEEGIILRTALPEAGIGVFNGLLPGQEKEFLHHRLTPVLNDLGQAERWRERPAILHVDTGMTRLGLNESDLKKTHGGQPATGNWQLMSHLACANEPEHPKNAEQLSRFKAALELFPGARASLCNSSGLFLPQEFHFDLGRPGCALYGINPVSGENPMRHVATLSAPIVHIRTLDRDETVGYGASHAAKKGARIAIAALGYADGLFRSLSNRGFAEVAGERAPFAGRVSMDMIALDVSRIPGAELAGARAKFIHAGYTVNDMAQDCGTIGYEIFTRIGARVKRVYA